VLFGRRVKLAIFDLTFASGGCSELWSVAGIADGGLTCALLVMEVRRRRAINEGVINFETLPEFSSSMVYLLFTSFSLCHINSPVWRYRKTILYDLLFRASAETLLEVAAYPKHVGAEIGFFSAAQLGTKPTNPSLPDPSKDYEPETANAN